MFAFGPAVTRIEVCELSAFHDNISCLLIIIIIAIDYIIMLFFLFSAMGHPFQQLAEMILRSSVTSGSSLV